jgi:hypothetical protein
MFNFYKQVDLIDFSVYEQDEYKWIMHYQDHLCKFSHLVPLKSKLAVNVALELFRIFCIQGAPCILQSDNGSEFVAEVVKELRIIWPDMIIVHGRPRHPQSQGSVERSNQDVSSMIYNWMRDNKSKKWPLGCYMVQSQKNNRYHSGIKMTPYVALFGQKPRVGLNNLPVGVTILNSLDSEDDLMRALSTDEQTVQGQINSSYFETNETSDSGDNQPELSNSGLDYSDPSLDESDQDSLQDSHCNNRLEIRSAAANAMQKQAEAMKKQIRPAREGSYDLSVGSVVLVSIDKVDKCKMDGKRVPGVVVEITEHNNYRVVCKGGVFRQCYSRADLIFESDKTIDSFELRNEFENWRTLPKITERGASSHISMVGGQGHKHCNCIGKCDTNRCGCQKLKVKCNSRCKCDQSSCQNC